MVPDTKTDCRPTVGGKLISTSTTTSGTSHSKVAPENVGLQKGHTYKTFASHTCNEIRLCLGNSQKGSWKLATRKDKIKIIKTKKTVAQPACRSRCQSWGEMRGACLLSRRSEDVSLFFGRASVHSFMHCPRNPSIPRKSACSQRRIIGPMFFDTTVTSQVYIELFREFVNRLDDQELTLGYYQ
jgi:hypothetical protein